MRAGSLRWLRSLAMAAAVMAQVQAAFKELGQGARAGGMGNAFAAVANDASSLRFNPAGLARVDSAEFSFMYQKPFAGFNNVSLNTQYVATALPVRRTDVGTFGFDYSTLVLPGLTRESQFTFGFGRWLYESPRQNVRVAAGLNLKGLTKSLNVSEANIERVDDPVFGGTAGTKRRTVFTGDLGVLVALDRLSIGLAARNLTMPDASFAKDGSDAVPLELRQGVAYNFGDLGPAEDFTPTVDWTYRKQRKGAAAESVPADVNVLFGLETWFGFHTWGARIGGNTREISLGFSFFKQLTPSGFSLQADYGFGFPFQVPDQFGNHRISLSFRYPLPFTQPKPTVVIPTLEAFAPPAAAAPPAEQAPATPPAPQEEEEAPGEAPPPPKVVQAPPAEEPVPATEAERQTRMKTYYEIAYQAYRGYDYAKAAQYWQKLLDLDPTHALSQKNLAKAKEAFARQIDLNTATYRDLRQIGLTTRQAREVLSYRTSWGGFSSVEGILRVPGIGQKTFLRIRPRLRAERIP